MYTLLGASVLGFDLVRRVGGGAVASLLVDAMALTPEDLPVLASARPLGLLTADDRTEVDSATERSPLSTALGQMSRLVEAGRVKEALQLIERAPMAGLADLLACVRNEVFDWTWQGEGEARSRPPTVATAVAVVCDAVTAAYHPTSLRDGLAQQLIEPWAIAQAALPLRRLDLGPAHAELDAMLAELSRLDREGHLRLLEAAREARGRGGWAQAMHSASWAVHLADRVRPSAAAQLRAVRVLSDADVSVTDAAAGSWNVVSGAVQATVVADLLDDESAALLLGPVRRTLAEG
ncbi:MAG TPA: hypothetical protein VFG72_15875 [Marmoricola sp.]|nr:hypothetical protein [Marmoricola sp.]